MADYDGWLMPKNYGRPADEYDAYKNNVALFDQSDKYRIRLTGKGAGELLEKSTTLNVKMLGQYAQQETSLCNQNGQTIEKCTVQRQDKGFLLIGSPASHQKIFARINEHAENMDVRITDETLNTAMVTLKGPAAFNMLAEKLPFDISQLQTGELAIETVFFMRLVVALSQTEPMPEVSIIMPAKTAGLAWGMLEKYGDKYGVKLAGKDVEQIIRTETGQ